MKKFPIRLYALILSSRLIRKRPWLIRRKRIKGKRILDVGCGPHARPQKINLDFIWQPAIDVCWSVERPLPFADNSLEGVFTEHCLEHVTFDACRQAIGEFFRILQPGGWVRIVVPDGNLFARRYVERTDGLTQERFPGEHTDAISGIYSPIMSVNRIFRDFGHRYISDYALLKELCERASFVDIEEASYRVGRFAPVLLDTEARSKQSVYVEARKPG